MDSELITEMDIHTACSLGDEEFVKQILDCKTIDVDTKTYSGWTPLMYACWGGHEVVVELLLRAGASLAALNHDHQPPLILATKSGSLPIVKLAFQRSTLDHVDNNGKTAFYYAVEFVYLDIATYLLMEGADVNFSCGGLTPLMVAAVSGQRPLVELLLAYGAQRHPHNIQGFTALQLANRHSHHELADLLDTTQQDFSDLKRFLESLSLEKYHPIFESQDIDLRKFLQLNEEDLKSLGIKLLGPRRKMSLAIASFTTPQTSL